MATLDDTRNGSFKDGEYKRFLDAKICATGFVKNQPFCDKFKTLAGDKICQGRNYLKV